MKNDRKETYVTGRISAALWELLEQKKMEEISITDLTTRAGVSRVSFYRNYENKEAVLIRDLSDITDRFLEETGISYKNDPLPVYFETLFSHMKKNETRTRTLYRAGLINLVKDQFDRVFMENYREVYDPYQAGFYAGGIFNVYLLWLQGGGKESPKKMAEKLQKLMEK